MTLVRRYVRRRQFPQLRVEPVRVGSQFSGTKDVYIDGQLVGHYRVEFDPFVENHASIAWVGVRGDVRRKGFGRRIVNKILDDLRAKKIKHVTLVAAPEAIGFWEKMGFTGVGESSDLGNLVMEKRL